MARTIKRQPFTVSTNAKDYTKSYIFGQTQFNGLYDGENDITVDQQTFADTENVYVDEKGVFTSRNPFKFNDGEAHIIEQWSFSTYKLRMYRIYDSEQFIFVLRCVSHNVEDEMQWVVPENELGWDFVPKTTCVQIEDKIFVWFAGVDFVAFNTSRMKFEDATKYLYCPIHKQIVNGLESDLETKNFLTDTYRKRYLYSSISSVDFNALQGKQMRVNLNSEFTQNTSKHLYDITVGANQEQLLLYPYSPIGSSYHIDIVQTPNALVILRYDKVSRSIAISYDGRYFTTIQSLDGIVGEPLLTRDGLWVVAFTKTGLAKYKLAAQDSEDFSGDEISDWIVEPYPPVINSNIYNYSYTGYFETIDQFAYVCYDATEDLGYLFMSAPHGASGIFSGYRELSGLYGDDIKIYYRYIAPTENAPNLGPAIGIFARHRTEQYFLDIHFFDFDEDEFSSDKLVAVLLSKELPSSTYIGETDIYISVPNDIENNIYDVIIAYGLHDTVTSEVTDYMSRRKVTRNTPAVILKEDVSMYSGLNPASSFKIKADTSTILTDKYLYSDGILQSLPDIDTDRQDIIRNTDILTLHLTDEKTNSVYMYQGKIHKVTLSDGVPFLSKDTIHSGDIVVYVSNLAATSEYDYLVPELLPGNEQPQDTILAYSNLYYIEKLATIVEDGVYKYVGIIDDDNGISTGELIRLRAYIPDNEKLFRLPIGHPGNLYMRDIGLCPREYPDVESDWEPDWEPTDWPTYPPIYPTVNAETGMIESRFWQEGDALPTGGILLYGVANLEGKVRPLSADDTGIWYNINGTLWTSYLDETISLELDEYVNAIGFSPKMNSVVPDKYAVLNEHYFSFVHNGKNLLEVTQTKRDDDALLSNDGTDLLLYLPKRNEQYFANKITALHPLSNTEIGVFTNDDVWYIRTSALNDGIIAYTKPIKSNIPIGLRDGSDVITAFDGQALIFPARRGLVALAPQDFVATTEKTLSYLSDAIQAKYLDFYESGVQSTLYLSDAPDDMCKPYIHICTHKYWLMLYKYLDREILLLDTRTNSWWTWTTPYPILSISADKDIEVLMRIDFLPSMNTQSLSGVSFVYTSDDNYKDDIIEGTLNGSYSSVYDNEYIKTPRQILQRASSMIDWHFTSQKLHFDQINNYKAVKGITLNLKGNDTTKVKMTTRAFRDLYHPEKDDVVAITINELRTFIKRFNLMHVLAFQYTIENDTDIDMQYPFRLNALSIKYEVKERVR